MSTSGQGAANTVLYLVLVVLALGLARMLGGPAFRPPLRPAAVALWLVVAVPSLVQLVVPALLDALMRDPDLVMRGQWWRLATSTVVQDGGVAGTVSNLVLLALVAVVAGTVWGGARMLVVVAVVQVGFGLWTSVVFPSPGAGNSGLTYGLAASLAGLALTRGRRESLPGRPGADSLLGPRLALTVGVVAVGVALVALLDSHGVAVLVGVVTGVVLGAATPPQSLDVSPARHHDDVGGRP
ncbi:MAG: rhomboid family intramembrane serine protease [Actinomycetes bacterium]